VDAYALFLLDEPARRLTRQAAFGLPDAPGPGGALPLDAGSVGRVAASGRPCHLPDVRTDPSVAQAGFPGQGALLAVPLRLPGGRVLGVLAAHKPGPAAFTPNDRELFEAVATQVAVALENAQLYQRTKELSARDELTRLFNRRAFFENLESEVQRARRYRRTFGVLMLDLDHFKHYNDTHGHLRGDEVLRELGRLLLGTTRRADVVARFGGEEFVILLPEVSKAGGAIVAEKIRAAVATAPFYGREQQPGGALTATLGLAAYPGDAEDGLELVDRADRALYTGKQLGGNRVALAAGRNRTAAAN
jgi:diguanylate cyclase (GGDEF)-like protein